MTPWQRICLPVQKTEFQSLIQKNPTCLRATKPASHNYWVWAQDPQALSPRPAAPGPVCPGARAPRQEKPLQWDARTPQLESGPYSPRPGTRRGSEDPAQPKINKYLIVKKNSLKRSLLISESPFPRPVKWGFEFKILGPLNLQQLYLLIWVEEGLILGGGLIPLLCHFCLSEREVAIPFFCAGERGDLTRIVNCSVLYL